ncbi:serine/threonine protein phosphatase, partial [Achromatium sp. WMS2]
SGVLQAINAVLSHDNDDCHFVTMLCAILEIKTGNLTYASAGHDSPLLLRNKRGQWLELETGPALGLFDDSEFPEHTEQLHTDDLLLLYTDGITEAKNPEGDFFTAERLQSVLERHPPDNPIRLVRSVQHFYQHFLEDAPASDDLTLLALHYLPNNTFYTKGKAMEWTISLNNELTA